MNADHKSIEDWMNDVRRGTVRLPRFQRDETWTPSLVSDFIEAVLLKRPLGVFLVLRVISNDQPFETRSIAEAVNNGEMCKEHLLDGQQRLMALWRAFKDTYDGYAFYAEFEETPENSYKFTKVASFTRGGRNRKWIGKPNSEFAEKRIPISVLEPSMDGTNRATAWKHEATNDAESSRRLAVIVDELRSIVGKTLIPFLAMPEETDPDQAIDTFIKSNTSSVRLNAFEIAVAQFEAAIPASRRKSSPSLRDLVDAVKHRLPQVVRLEGESNIGDLVLKVACVRNNMKPTYGNYGKIISTLEKDWKSLFNGLKWAAEFLKEEHILDARILPSTVPLRVLSALQPLIPEKGDKLSKGRRLLRKYLWRSFVTDRYERDANGRLFEDFKALKVAFEDETLVVKCSSTEPENIFSLALPEKEDILAAGWPASKGILKRAILAVSTIKGARDVATGRRISDQSVKTREHHHIFPDNLLKSFAEGENPNLALNCMLLEAPTNNNWRDEWPGDYLIERVERSDLKGEKAREEIETRLESHYIPADLVMKAKRKSEMNLAKSYQAFLTKRAKIIMEVFEKLCEGEDL